MTDSGLKPRDLEMIAAFVDRRLSEEERRAFQERLDKEEALYEVFAETVRYRDQQTSAPAVVIEHPASRRRWRRLAAVAALVAVAVATPVVLRNLGGERYAERLVADGRLDPAPGGGWYEQGWRRTRGISALPEAEAAFRAGVLAIDLEIALRLARREDAADLTRRLESTVASMELAELSLARYERLRLRIASGAPAAELLELAEKAESGFAARFPELGSPYRLGRWAEAGKLAAGSGNRDLLRSRAFRRELGELTSGQEEWDESVRARLQSIGELIDRPANELQLDALGTAFTAIIDEA